MKTRKLSLDDFRENQLSVIGQRSINGGLPPEGEPIGYDDGTTPPNGTPPSGGIPTAPLGNIRVDEYTITDPVLAIKTP